MRIPQVSWLQTACLWLLSTLSWVVLNFPTWGHLKAVFFFCPIINISIFKMEYKTEKNNSSSSLHSPNKLMQSPNRQRSHSVLEIPPVSSVCLSMSLSHPRAVAQPASLPRLPSSNSAADFCSLIVISGTIWCRSWIQWDDMPQCFHNILV